MSSHFLKDIFELSYWDSISLSHYCQDQVKHLNNNIALDNIDTTIKDIDVCRNICYPFKLNVEAGKNKKDSFYKGKKELVVLTSQETKLTQRNSGNQYSLNACISINGGSQNSNGNCKSSAYIFQYLISNSSEVGLD